MKSYFTKSLLFIFLISIQSHFQAQCGSVAAGGSASNMFTQIRNATQPVVADKNLNTVVFIHRNNATAFGGSSGNLRYDVSINGGVTWTNDQGVLNPINSSLARYPNLTLYNPTNNINPANAYISYMAATINSVTSAWNGVVTGVRQLSGAGNTENYNQPIVLPQLIPHSIVKGAPGVFWAIDGLFNGSIITGFAIYKGVWNSSVNDVVWSTNYSVTPSFASAGTVADYNIAFDPSGTYGWFSFLSKLSPGPSNSSYYPIFYKTTNGGLTWTGPIQVDLDQFNCISSNMISPNVSTTNFEHDLTVDVFGNPHLLTTVCTGNNGFSVLYGSWHHMYDFTQINGVWAAYDIANVNAGRGTWGVSPNQASMDMAPQVGRSADGTKLFFTWSDNNSYLLGAANLSPNFFAKGFDVVQNKWTSIKDFSSCNVATNGKILFPHLAPEVLEPSLNVFKLAPVFGEHTLNNDPLQISNFKFLDNCTFAASEFSVANSAAAVNIQQGNNLLLCPTGSLVINIPGGNYGQILWSNGATTNATSVSSGTNAFYYVTVQQNCVIAIDTIFVNNLTFTTAISSPSVCPGNSTSLSVSGNAFSYLWNPGSISGTLATINPTSSTVFTISASGSNSCIATQTVPITVFSLPTITVAGPDSICQGSSVTHTASGANTYTWSHGAFGNIATTSPTSNVTYTIGGTDVNLCSSSQTISIEIIPLPTLSIVSTRSVICKGETSTLTVSGAGSYSWSGGTTNSVLAVTPSLTTTYSVVGTNTFGCSKPASFTQSVSLCTTLSTFENRPFLFNVFPNPSEGDVTISSETDLNLSLTNGIGQEILKLSLDGTNMRRINIGNLSAGIYFLSTEVSGKKLVKKIVISH